MRYCVDFQTGIYDWIGSGDETDAMGADQFTCARGWVVIQSSEFAGLSSSGQPQTFTTGEIAALKAQAANPSVLNLSPPEGAQVGGAIVLTWAVAWVVKALVRSLNVDGDFEK